MGEPKTTHRGRGIVVALIDRVRLFSLREFAVHRGRTLASITVVAVSAAFLVAVLGALGSLTGSVDRLVGGLAGNAALEVSGITDAGFPQAVQQSVAAVPGVAVAVPMVRTQAVTASGPVLVLGADASGTALDSDVKEAILDQFGGLLTVPNGVLVGPGLGRQQGDQFAIGTTRVTVAGVLHGSTLSDLNDGHYVLAALPLTQRITGRPGRVDSVLIVAQPGTDAAAMRNAVTDAVAGRAVVGDPMLRAAQTGSGIRMLRYMTLTGAANSFVVAAFLIYTTMTMAITQRRPVLSMLRAIGGRRRTIVGDLLAEAAVLGIVGGAIGAVAGIGMGRLAIGSLPSALLQTIEVRFRYALPWYAIPLAIAASVLTSVAASAIAARQVYKVSPIEALAPIGVSTADRVPRKIRIVAAVLALVDVGVSMALLANHLGMLVPALLALVLFFGAGIALCFAFTDAVVKATAGTARLVGAAGALAAATLERAPRRVWATVMTVFIAAAITVTITGANRDLLASGLATFSSVKDVDVWVASNPATEIPLGPVLPTDLQRTVAALPEVGRVVPEQLAFAALNGTKVTLYGVTGETAEPLSRAVDPGVRADLLAGRGAVLTRDLGRTLHVGVGDELPLQTPHGIQRTRVLALVSYFSPLTGSVAISLDQMQAWFDRPGATVLEVDGKPGVSRAAVLAAVRHVTPAGVHVYTGDESLAGAAGAINEGMAVANALWVIVVLIAAVALLNTLTLSVLERRREIGVLRAMGTSRRFALRMVLAEAAGIGIVGGVLGTTFGLAMQYVYDGVTPDIMNITVSYRPGPMVLGFAAGALVLSLLGSIPPALRAARLSIVDAIGIE